VNGSRFTEYFCGAAPDHYEPAATVARFELLNVGHERFGRLHFVRRGFDIRAMDPPDVVAVKNRLHWVNGGERFPHAFEQAVV
jgi:hypothetical protein